MATKPTDDELTRLDEFAQLARKLLGSSPIMEHCEEMRQRKPLLATVLAGYIGYAVLLAFRDRQLKACAEVLEAVEHVLEEDLKSGRNYLSTVLITGLFEAIWNRVPRGEERDRLLELCGHLSRESYEMWDIGSSDRE